MYMTNFWQIFPDGSELSFSEFVELVVGQDVRPECPDAEDSQLSDAVWRLAEKCWVKDPKDRPTANVICDTQYTLPFNWCHWYCKCSTNIFVFACEFPEPPEAPLTWPSSSYPAASISPPTKPHTARAYWHSLRRRDMFVARRSMVRLRNTYRKQPFLHLSWVTGTDMPFLTLSISSLCSFTWKEGQLVMTMPDTKGMPVSWHIDDQ